MPTLFDEIVNRRPKVDIRPLWKLKLTEREFEELRSYLNKAVIANNPDLFSLYPRECVLFFAEYWKRCFDGGPHSRRDVLDCLCKGVGDSFVDAFYKAAKKGAMKLRIEIAEIERERSFSFTLDSILYQGGLPMRLICQTERDVLQNWPRFVRRLIRGYIDLQDESLGLGVVATQLKSIREYAEQLYLGIATDDPGKMPFYCPDRDHPWFKALMHLKESERRRSNEENPFAIQWMLDVNDHSGEGRVLGRVLVPSKLSSAFLEQHEKADDVYTSAQIMADGRTRCTIEYQRGFSRSSRDILIPLTDPDTVVTVDFEGFAVATGSFDFTRPHLFGNCMRQSNGLLRGEKTNRMKETEMMVYVPEGWEYAPRQDIEVLRCVILGADATILRLSHDFIGELEIKGPDGDRVTFGGIRTIGETQLIFKPLYSELVISPVLCDASDIRRCRILKETEDGILPQPRPVEFRRGREDWSAVAPYGKIKARGKGEGTDVCEPVSLCNVGSAFKINIVEADADSARINVQWPHGRVTCVEDGAVYYEADDAWTVRREDLLDSVAVRFRLTVGGDSFLVRLRAPFRQFEVTDELGERVRGRVCVPFCDYDKFSYTINGHDSAKVTVRVKEEETVTTAEGEKLRVERTVAKESYRLNAHGRRLEMTAGDDLTACAPRDVYRHGSIAAIFGSLARMRQRLEKQKGTIVNSKVHATLHVDGCPQDDIELIIKEFPFKVDYDAEENVFGLTDEYRRPRQFRHSLLAFRLGNPTADPVLIEPDEEEVLRMPDELKSETDILVAGKVPGRVLPALFNKSDTVHTPAEITAVLESVFLNAKLGSDEWKDALDWFDTVSEHGLHYTSLLQLRVIGKSKDIILPFAFQCMLRYGTKDREVLEYRLMQFSRDLNFKWFWLIPTIRRGLMMQLMQKMDDTSAGFIKAMVPPELFSILQIEALKQLAIDRIAPKINEFEQMLHSLVKKSLNDAFVPVSPDMLEASIGWIGQEGRFEGCTFDGDCDQWPDLNMRMVSVPDELKKFREVGKTPNENWLLMHAKAFAAHLEEGGATNIFSMGGDTRRSLCLSYDIAPDIFIREAHNEMQRMRNNTKKR